MLKMTTPTAFNDLPEDARIKIFGQLSEVARQQNRIVSPEWNNFINEQFPLEIEITNENISNMLKRGNAYKATVRDLTAEIHENISFSNNLRQLEAAGKIVTSNLTVLLKSCRNIEMLSFSSLKEILTIESTEIVELPKVFALQIKVRGEHQMFTLAEMILIDWLTKRLEFGGLKVMMIKTCSPAEIWAEIRFNRESSQRFSESSSISTIGNLSREMTAVSSAAHSGNILHPITGHRNLMNDPRSGASLGPSVGTARAPENSEVLVQNVDTVSRASQFPPDMGESGPLRTIALASNSNTIPTVASAGTATTEDGNQSQSNTDSAYSYSRQSIFDRVLQRNALNTEEDTEDTGEVDGLVVRDTYSLIPSYYFHGSFTDSSQAAVGNSVFIKLLLKNHKTLNQLIVNVRNDFLCFGSLVQFTEECHKLQFENLEYNFGRSAQCMEFMLLQAQTKLTRIRIQFFENMTMPFLTAVIASSDTLREVDVKIISFNEDSEPFPYQIFSKCHSLTCFRMLQFTRKAGLETLPISIERLLLNGPLTSTDLKTLASRLINLVECNILINMNVETVDVDLFKVFLRLPKLRLLSFVQCEIDVDGIEAFCQKLPGLNFTLAGPRKLNTLPDIQYAMTRISENFQHELII